MQTKVDLGLVTFLLILGTFVAVVGNLIGWW
jgi:hypothetical protein